MTPAWQCRTRYHRPQQLGAGGIVERLETAGQRVHQIIVGGLVGEIGIDVRIADIVGNIDEHLVRLGPFGRANIVL